MKKVKDLMTSLGFNPDASFAAKKAFINHLIQEAHFQQIRRNPQTPKLQPLEKVLKTGEQLSLFEQESQTQEVAQEIIPLTREKLKGA